MQFSEEPFVLARLVSVFEDLTDGLLSEFVSFLLAESNSFEVHFEVITSWHNVVQVDLLEERLDSTSSSNDSTRHTLVDLRNKKISKRRKE